MAGINAFLGTAKKGSSKVERFEKLSEGKTPRETRDLEMELLQPEVIPTYAGEQPKHSAIYPNRGKAIKFGFKTKEEVALVKKYFHVNQYVEQNVSEVSLLIALLKALEEGTIKYDAKTNVVSVPE